MLSNILTVTREQNNQDLGEDDSNDADYTPGGHGGVDDYPAKRVTNNLLLHYQLSRI